MITIADLTPVAFCIQTDDLFDFRTFKSAFADYIILMERDKELSSFLMPMKRKLNSPVERKNFLEGYKLIIIRNLDKIIALVKSRYQRIDLKTVEKITTEGKKLIREVILAEDFDAISKLEPRFKSKIMLPTYSLFNKLLKR